MAKEKMLQEKRMGCSPLRFSPGISPKKEPCATHSVDITPTTLQFELSPNKAPSGSITTISEQHIYQGNENAISIKKSQETTKDIHKPVDNQGKKKGKQVVLRQQSERIVKQMSFQCRLPYLKHYREATNRLNPERLMLVDYAFLPPDELHPST